MIERGRFEATFRVVQEDTINTDPCGRANFMKYCFQEDLGKMYGLADAIVTVESSTFTPHPKLEPRYGIEAYWATTDDYPLRVVDLTTRAVKGQWLTRDQAEKVAAVLNESVP